MHRIGLASPQYVYYHILAHCVDPNAFLLFPMTSRLSCRSPRVVAAAATRLAVSAWHGQPHAWQLLTTAAAPAMGPPVSDAMRLISPSGFPHDDGVAPAGPAVQEATVAITATTLAAAAVHGDPACMAWRSHPPPLPLFSAAAVSVWQQQQGAWRQFTWRRSNDRHWLPALAPLGWAYGATAGFAKAARGGGGGGGGGACG